MTTLFSRFSVHVGLCASLLLSLSGQTASASIPQPTPSPASKPAAASEKVEHWIGAIYPPNASCPQVTFVVTFRLPAGAEQWAATLSITPGCSVGGMLNVEMKDVVYTDTRIQFVSPPPPADNLYDLVPEPDKQSARGQLLLGRQQPVLIRMRRATADEARDAAPRRPQMPTLPLPYQTREVSITNPDDAITLSGVVTLPPQQDANVPGGAHPAKRPAVILLGDENPHDMDQTEGFHKPGLVLADQLTRQGIIVLRYDDRGMGKSGGSSLDQTLLQVAGDAKAAASLLATLPEVDPARIGLIGRGEGAIVAAMAAAENTAIGFVVLMAPAAVTWKDVLILRERRVLEAQGEDPDYIKDRIERYTKLLDLAVTGKNLEELRAGLRADMLSRGDAQRMGGAANDFQATELAESQIQYLTVPRVMSRLTVDPKPYLEKLCCPVLALAGELDMHTPAKDTMPGVEAALRVCPGDAAKRLTTRVFPATNHWFQPCNTGFDDEYDQIELTISPEVLRTIAEWVNVTPAKP